MGYTDEERRSLKIQGIYEDMERLTGDPQAEGLLTVYELAVEELLPRLQGVLAAGVREGMFGAGIGYEKATLSELLERMLYRLNEIIPE